VTFDWSPRCIKAMFPQLPRPKNMRDKRYEARVIKSIQKTNTSWWTY